LFKRIKKVIVILFAVSSVFFISLNYAIPLNEVQACPGMGKYYDTEAEKCVDTSVGVGKDDGGEYDVSKLESTIVPVANTIAAILLALSVISIIYGGMEFVLAGLNMERAERGKKRILYTFLAIVLILSAFSVFRLVKELVLG